MARVFAYLMEERRVIVSDEGIFKDCSQVIYNALLACYNYNSKNNYITSGALEIALNKLLTKKD